MIGRDDRYATGLMGTHVPAALVLFGLVGVFMPAPVAALVISEFAADNETIVADDDGDFSDWLEIHNDSGVGSTCKVPRQT